MFESILEKVLLKAAGEYIDGIDGKNLKVGIWGGDVVIENVSLKDGIIDMLDLPVSLRFSHIGKLTLKVPWKNLSSAPVEVYLDGVYLIISPKHSSEWTFKDYKGLKQKLDNINQYAEECLKKFQETHKKQQTQDKDAGYVDKLTMKIIDNLQLSIKSIHIRYEDTLTKSSSWGITLDQLDIFTTDAYDKRIFVDRTKPENKEEPMRKTLQLSNLGIYWNATEKNMLALDSKSRKLDIMEGMIKRGHNTDTRVPCKYLLSISSTAKLIQSAAGKAEQKPNIPEISFNINLDRIDFTLEQTQLQQIIKMAEYFSLYQKKLSDQKKASKQLTDMQIQKLQKKFCNLYKRIQETETKVPEILPNDDKQQFENALLSLEYEDLYECTKKVMIEIAKSQKIQDLEKTKQKQKQGMFGGWFGSKKKEEVQESLVTESDLDNIDKFFEENFAGEGLTVTNYKRPESYVWFILNFSLQGSHIKLNRENKKTNEIEGITLNIDTIFGNLKMRDDNLELECGLKSITLDNVTYQPQLKQEQVQNFLRPNQTVGDKNLINIGFEQKPMSARHIDTKVKVDIQSARIEYNPIFVQRITQFFDVSVENEDLKNAAFDAAQELKDKAQESSSQAMVSPSVMWLDVHLASPIIVLPFKNDGSIQNEAWIVNLGDLTVKSNPAILAANLSDSEKMKDMYDINLTNIKMQYFPTLEYYNQLELNPSLQWQVQKGQIDKYRIINDFNISVGIVILKQNPPNKQTGKIQVKGELPKLYLDLNQEMYKRLLKMGEIFAVDEEITSRQASMSLEAVLTEKKALLQKAQKVGPLYLRGETLHTWSKKTAVLSGRYLYIFASPKDQQAETHYWINNSELNPVSEENYGYPNAFQIKNKYTDIIVATDKPDTSEKWQIEIGKQRTGPRGIKQSMLSDNLSEKNSSTGKSDKTHKQKEQIVDFLQKNLSAQFQINDVKLSLFDAKDNNKCLLTFETKSIGLIFDQYAKSFDCKLSLGGMYLRDYIYNYLDPKLENFITSEDIVDQYSSQIKQDVELIVVNVSQKTQEHPHFKGVEMDIQVKLGNLIINFKPDTLLKVLGFIKVDEPEHDNIQLPESGPLKDLTKDDSSDMTSDTQVSTIQLKQPVNDNILMQANVELKKIKLVFVNRRTHLALGSLQIQNIAISFKQKADEMILDGTLGNLQMHDLTNYPSTIYKEEDYDKVVPQEILGLLKQEGQQQSLLTIYFRGLQEGSPKIGKDNVSTFLKVRLSQIHINFMMQPIMRFLDFTLVQALGPLTTPELFEDDSKMTQKQKDALKQKQTDIKDPLAPLRALGKAKVRKDLLNPKGMDMDVEIKAPLIQLKPNPTEENYMQIDLGNIKITNSRVLNSDRIIESQGTGISETYSDQFNICLQDMQIGFIRQGKYIEMSQLFHFNIKIEMPTLVNEYWFVFKDKLKIDKTMKLRCYISPIILKMTNREYCLLMRCLFHNVTYDDGCDRFMIHDYFSNLEKQKEMANKQESKLAMIQKFGVSNDNQSNLEGLHPDREIDDFTAPPQEAGAIDFQLDMENLSFFAAEGEIDIIPFARVTLNDLRIQFIKESNGDVQTNLYGFELDGSCFKKVGCTYQETGLLRKIDIDKTYTEEEMLETTNLLDQIDESSVQGQNFVGYEFPKFPDTHNQQAFDNSDLQFIMELNMSPSGDKNMKIKIQDFKVVAETGPLLKLAGFANTDDSVIAPPAWYIPEVSDEQQLQRRKEIQQLKMQEIKEDSFEDDDNGEIQENKPFFDLEEENKKKEQELEQEKQEAEAQGSMNIDVILHNVIICAIIPNSNQTLAIKGEFDIKILFQPRSVTLEEIQHKVKQLAEEQQKMSEEEKALNKIQNHFKTTNEVQNFNVIIEDLEIFLCDKTDLQKKQFKQVKKREILHPLSVKVLMQTFNPPLYPEYKHFYNRSVIDVDVNKLILKISSKDSLLLQQSLDYILGQMNEGKSEEDLKKEQEEKQKKKEEEEQKALENYDPKLKMTAEQKQELLDIQDDPSKMVEQIIKCNVVGLQIIIINDIGQIFTPVLDFNILETKIMMNTNSLQSKISISPLIFGAKYYNPRVGQWEPIIEQIGFNIDMINNQIGNIKQHIVVEIHNDYTQFQLNISTQFIAVLLQMLNLIKQNTKKQDDKQQSIDSVGVLLNTHKTESNSSFQSQLDEEVEQKVSPYSIRNETGYAIEVELQTNNENIKQEKVIVKNNHTINFDVSGDLNEDLFFKKEDQVMTNIQSTTNQHKVQVKFRSKNLEGISKQLNNINIDRMRYKQIYFGNNPKMPLTATTEVKLDLVTNRKILYVSSPYIFVNNTKLIFFAKFGDKEKDQILGDEIKVKPGHTVPVPLDCTKKYFQLTLMDSKQIRYQSPIQKVSELSIKVVQDKHGEDVEQGKKIDLSLEKNQHVRLRCEFDQINKHKIKINIEAPYKFKNCLPKPLLMQVLSQSKRTTITRQLDTEQIFEEFSHSAAKNIFLRINLPGFFWSNEVKLGSDDFDHIVMQDHNSHYSGIQVKKHQLTNGTIQYFIYCTAYLINESPYDLIMHTSKEKEKPIMVGGQFEVQPDEDIERNIIIFGEKQGEILQITDKQLPNKYSKPITITTPGNSEVETTIWELNQEQTISMGVDVQLLQQNSEPLIMTRKITVSPRFILVNNTNNIIMARQESGLPNKYLTIEKDQRVPIFWPDPSKPKLVNLIPYFKEGQQDISLADPQDSVWNWSQAIDVNSIGVQNFCLNNKNSQQIKYMRTDTREGGSNIFIVIEEVPEDQLPYKIINNTSFVDIEINTKGFEKNVLKQNESQNFGWFYPQDEKKLSVIIQPKDGQYTLFEYNFSPDIINNKEKIQVPLFGQKKGKKHTQSTKYIKKCISIEGYTKIITFEDSEQKEKLNEAKVQDQDLKKDLSEIQSQNDAITQKQQDNQSLTSRTSTSDIFKILQQINISFKGIGVSLIMNHQDGQQVKEVLYMYLKNLELIMLTKQKSKITQLRLQYFQIDNNVDHIVQHPVIFTPTKHKAHTLLENPKQFVNIYIEQNLTTNTITLYDNIIVDLAPMTIKIEEAFLNAVLDFYSAYNEINESITQEDQNAVQKRKDNKNLHDHLKQKQFVYLTAEIPPASAPTFIDQIVLTNIAINLTFQCKGRTGSKESVLPLFETVFSAIGVVLANIDDAPIKLNGIKLNACFDNMAGIVNKLVQHYKSQAISEGLKVVGSLNIIGNPVGLFSNISEGVSDLVDKPMEGLVQGPLETGMGIMKGSASLLTKTISGAFNSVSKMTGSVSSGIAALTMDEEYMRERDRMRAQKPKHVVDGVGQGIVSVFGGIGKGITGVFLKPFEGAKKEGVKGFFKGTVMGITGLVTKPLAGAIDLVAKTAEGMQNMVNMDDKPTEQRERAPRVFYGYDKFYKEYFHLDSEMLTVLQLYQKGRYAKENFFATFQFKINETNEYNHVLILLADHVILLSEKTSKREWIVPNKDIKDIRYTDQGIQLILSQKNKYTKSEQILLTITDKPMQKHVCDQIKELQNIYKDEEKFLQDKNLDFC